MNVCSLNSNRLDFSNKINCGISKNILLKIVKVYFLIKKYCLTICDLFNAM